MSKQSAYSAEELIAKLAKGSDLSSNEDLSIAIMNLVSLEEHFFFTYEKTGKGDYLEYLSEVRKMRGDLLRRILPAYEGETWCIAKHLLAASMRVYEVGTKALGNGNKEEAKQLFDKAFSLYGLFWGIVAQQGERGVVEVTGSKKHEIPAKHELVAPSEKLSFSDSFKVAVQKLIDCCRE